MPLVVKKIEKTIGAHHCLQPPQPWIDITVERIPGLGPLIERLMENISGMIDNRGHGRLSDEFLRDVVFVFTTLEVSTVVPYTNGRIHISYCEAAVETTDEIGYEWPHGSFW